MGSEAGPRVLPGLHGAEPLGHAGIAVAISVASTVQLFALVGLLRRKVGPLGLREISLSAGRTLLASAAMGAAAWPFRSLVDWGAGGTLVATLTFAGAGIASGVTFVIVAYALRSSELRDVLGAVRRRVKR